MLLVLQELGHTVPNPVPFLPGTLETAALVCGRSALCVKWLQQFWCNIAETLKLGVLYHHFKTWTNHSPGEFRELSPASLGFRVLCSQQFVALEQALLLSVWILIVVRWIICSHEAIPVFNWRLPSLFTLIHCTLVKFTSSCRTTVPPSSCGDSIKDEGRNEVTSLKTQGEV